jgi:hypothetical protein
MSIHSGHTIPRLYYYITPLFILLDYFGGINVRVAVLDSMPLYKNLYYGFCIFCAFGMYIRPRYSAVVALFESSIIFLMTVLGVFLPYVQVVMQGDDILNANWEAADAFTVPRITNLLLSGIIALFAFHGSLRTLGISDDRPGLGSGRSPESEVG